ncbi:MAG: hypothetical protein KJ904_16555 [Alphaproteobacteria bacterium]|nr:hypothetical protein [Alphaproteobacteria bacterium]MBU0798067.1 hypothetical protein [Alphaproteobacteria bacterium]MBU0888767.1 hypothetical protein [Alphaproteobacteria bacterium]MBU1812514.1 hypothetical protein [Alphaproteobacteria bacterium]MBU2091611.1 hypothetical protein [Alphaproteobacteria bacterium]
MSSDYLEKKVREALEQMQENPNRAAHLLSQWAQEDQKLLMALVRPMLKGLSLLAVQRSTGRGEQYRTGSARRRKPSQPITERATLEAVADALSGKGAMSMSSTRAAPTAPAEGSKRHLTSMKILAAAYKSKS